MGGTIGAWLYHPPLAAAALGPERGRLSGLAVALRARSARVAHPAGSVVGPRWLYLGGRRRSHRRTGRFLHRRFTGVRGTRSVDPRGAPAIGDRLGAHRRRGVGTDNPLHRLVAVPPDQLACDRKS